jgi:hypothetical protein
MWKFSGFSLPGIGLEKGIRFVQKFNILKGCEIWTIDVWKQGEEEQKKTGMPVYVLVCVNLQ